MTLMLLDSASLWYRAYYGMPDTLLAPDGTSVNAIRGYIDMTARLMNVYKPNRLVACLDGANRLEEEGEEEEEPETLTPQIPILLDLLDLFGIPVVGVDDYEADDVMATYAEVEKGPIRIVTGDRDLFQMVDDKRDIKVVYLAKGISQHDLVDIKYVADKYLIPGDRYDLFAMFRGDPSDGLPGVKGIGEKGAAVIANNFANVEDALAGALEAHESLPPALAKKIIAGADYLKIAPKLVRVARDAPLPKVDLALPKAPADLSSIYQFKERYALGASVDRLISALGW
jgi:5'-3' exonuclease